MANTYLVKLFQVQRSLTDSYTVEADSEEQAREQVKKIAGDRGLKDYDLELEDISAKAGAGATPEQDRKQEDRDGTSQSDDSNK